MKRTTATIIGIGPGSRDLLTERALQKIKNADIVVGWKISLDLVRGSLRGKRVLVEEAHNYPSIVREAAKICLEQGKDTVVLTTGDACVSAALEEIAGAFKGADLEVVPGISSVQIAAGIARITLEESSIISFHKLGPIEPRLQWMLSSIRTGRNVICLVDADFPPSWIAKNLLARGSKNVKDMLVCQNLSLPDQKVFTGSPKQISNKKFDPLSVVVIRVKREAGQVK